MAELQHVRHRLHGREHLESLPAFRRAKLVWLRPTIQQCLNSHLTLRKIAIWLWKNCPKLDIFSKFFGILKKKKRKFLAIFLEKMSSFWQFFDSQMAIFRRVRLCYTPMIPTGNQHKKSVMVMRDSCLATLYSCWRRRCAIRDVVASSSGSRELDIALGSQRR